MESENHWFSQGISFSSGWFSGSMLKFRVLYGVMVLEGGASLSILVVNWSTTPAHCRGHVHFTPWNLAGGRCWKIWETSQDGSIQCTWKFSINVWAPKVFLRGNFPWPYKEWASEVIASTSGDVAQLIYNELVGAHFVPHTPLNTVLRGMCHLSNFVLKFWQNLLEFCLS